MANRSQEQAITTKYLIIGNSAGGIGAAEAIRLVDGTGSVTVLSDEPYPVYSRPMISDYLARHATLERMLYRPADFYAKNKITTVFGKKATRLDPAAHTVELDSGERMVWEKALIATGGTPIISQVEGATKDNIFTFTTLDDAKAIDEFISEHGDSPLHAVVIGGGLIGFSVTEALVKRGVTVTIVEMKDRVLNTIIDEETSAIAQEALQKASVEVVCNHTVNRAATDAKGNITGVSLDDGRAIPCSLLIMAIGVRPRLDLVSGTGIKTNRGIVVDRHMMTSHEDVYACGDAAEAYDFVYGSNRLSPIWPNAYVGGRVSGSNMAGKSVEYAGGTAMNSLKYFGLAIASAGASVPPDSSYEVMGTKSDHNIRKIVIKDNVIAGMVLCGDVDKSGIFLGLMRDHVDISDFKKALLSPEFGLASLPETLWRERLGVVPAGFHAQAMKEEEQEELGAD
jgi:NAD(P)H-nitrite reductase large subunit